MGTIGKQTSSAGERCSVRDGMSEGNFDCNICLELAQEPVVTLCGHLFCWPCLYCWLNRHSLSQDCPVCKALVKEDTLVPLYGAGNPKPTPESKPTIPNRPLAPRPISTGPSPHRQTLHNNHQQGFDFMSNHPYSQPLGGGHMGTRSVTFTSGFGLFPPPLAPPPYGSTMLGSSRIPRSLDPIQQQQQQQQQQQRQWQDDLLHRLFLFLSCFTVVCLLFF